MNQHAQQISASTSQHAPQTTQQISAEPINTPISAAQCQISGSIIGVSGPQSQDDDEDSSPYVQDLDLEDHVSCSNHEMTTCGHQNNTLTHSGLLFGNPTKEVTPASPTKSAKDPLRSAKLTI